MTRSNCGFDVDRHPCATKLCLGADEATALGACAPHRLSADGAEHGRRSYRLTAGRARREHHLSSLTETPRRGRRTADRLTLWLGSATSAEGHPVQPDAPVDDGCRHPAVSPHERAERVRQPSPRSLVVSVSVRLICHTSCQGRCLWLPAVGVVENHFLRPAGVDRDFDHEIRTGPIGRWLEVGSGLGDGLVVIVSNTTNTDIL